MPLKLRFVDDEQIPVLLTPTTRRVRDARTQKDSAKEEGDEADEPKRQMRTPRQAALKAQAILKISSSQNRRPRNDSRNSDDIFFQNDEDLEDVEVDLVAPYTAGEGFISGEEVYNFNTPRRQPRPSSKTPGENPASTPTSTRRREKLATPVSGKPEKGSMPVIGRRRLNQHVAESSSKVEVTPDRNGKRRLKQKIQKITEDILEDLSSSEGSEFEPSESDSSSEASDENGSEEVLHSFKNISVSKPFQRTPGKPRRNRPAIDPDIDAESYFKSQVEENLTSNRTLARLKEPRLEKTKLDEILKSTKDCHRTERRELLDEHRSLFPKWLFLLGEGYNLLLYGFGSKSTLIEEFHASMLPNEDVLIVNGFFPSLSIKEILTNISFHILEMKESFHSNEEHVRAIEDKLEQRNKCVYLLLNNIDGSALQNEKSQAFLSALAGTPGIRLVASLDHMNAPLLWDHSKLSRFKFLWFDVTTFLPYTNETSFESSLMVQSTAGLALSSLGHVFESLTPNAKKIFILLAKFQLDNEDTESYKGLAFPELYRMCREAFLVNSDVTLRAQLTEFRDHKLLKSKRSADGVELISILLDGATIAEFLLQQDGGGEC